MSSNLLLKKISIFLTPLILVVFWEMWLLLERAAIEFGLLSLIVLSITVWFITLRPLAISQLQSSFHRKEFWRFMITPAFFITGGFLFLLIFENRFWQHLVILVVNFLLAILLQNMFDRFYQGSRYPARSFESISSNINSISLFFFSVVFYSFYTFLNTPIWLLACLLLFITTLLIYQTMWISGLEIKKSWLYILVIDLAVIELFWVLFFLPNTFYIKALVITVVYYLALNLSRNYLIKILNSKMIWRYLAVGAIILGLAFSTAQWL